MATTGNFKNQLMTALHDAVQHFNTDNDPNSAIVKTAKAYDFNTDQTSRLVEMFNTARTIYHYKSASDRTAQFALADIDTVIPALFTTPATEVKAASAAYHDYSAYDQRERNYHTPVAPDVVKSAEAQADEAMTGRTLNGITEHAMKALHSHRQVIKMAEDEARIAGSTAAMALRKLASLFALGSDKSKLEDQYARLVVGFGNDVECKPVVDKLAAFINKKDQAPATKIAFYKRQAIIDDRDLHPHLALMKEAKEWMETEAELLASAGQLQKEADAFECEFMATVVPFLQPQAVNSLAAFVRPEVMKAAADAGSGTTIEGITKYKTRNLYGEDKDVTVKDTSGGTSGPGIADMISGSVMEGAKKPVTDFLNTGIERAFVAPQERANKQLSERLKNVQRSIMLQDLLVNDPILSEEAPERVVEAYNALMQLAPEVATNKEVARAILRQTVHSVAVSPYDADSWTRLEMNLRNISGRSQQAGAQQQGGKK